MRKGFSLIELMIAMGVFAVLAVSANVLLANALRNARKASAISIAKSEGAYALNTIIQEVKYSDTIVTCRNAPAPPTLTVRKNNGSLVTYTFGTGGGYSYVASGSARLTSNRVNLSTAGCPTGLFTCPADLSSVEVCFWVDVRNSTDVSNRAGALGTSGLNFRGSARLRNFGN